MLMRGATVLSMDPAVGDLSPGDVRISGGRIAAVGPDLPGDPDEEIVDGTGCLLVPGFVDTHRHMWEGAFRGAVPGGTLDDYFRRMLLEVAPALTPADLAISEAVSARASLAAGITTVQDTSDIHDSPERTDAIVGALEDSGLRTVFAYGLARTVLLRDGSALPDDVRRLRTDRLADDDALVTLALATSDGDDDAERHNAALARDLGVRTAHHVRPAIPPSRLRDLGALVPGTTFVHGNGLSADELAVIAEAGGSLSIAPVVEMALGLGHPMVGEALATPGLPITLSVDVEVTGPTDMFSAMRAAYLQARLDGATTSPHEVLGWATIGGAQALGLDARTGSITPGKAADLVLLRADRLDAAPVDDPAGAVVLQMDRAHVDTVLVDGVVHVRGGRPVRDDGPLIEQARALAARFRS